MKGLFAVALAGILAAAPALSVPITYSFDGRLSGSLDGELFTLANIELALDSDTDTVFQPSPTVRPTLFNTAPGTLRFDIAGRTGTFDASYNAFVVTLGFAGTTLVGLTETNSNDLIDVADPGLAGYDLRGPAGPVANSPLDFLNFDTPFSTSLGTLIFFDDEDAAIAFTARTGAAAVPEPAAWATMALGFGMLGAAVRRRRVRVQLRLPAPA